MKSRIETEADRREGTWTADNLQAVANELARIYEEDIDTILPQAFVMTARGRNLDSCCSDYGITRRAATAAEAVVQLQGEPGTYPGIQLSAGELTFTVPETFTIPPSDAGYAVVSVRAVCDRTGDIGNVAAGSIDRADDAKITKVINPDPAEGGFDTESDDALRERTLEHIRTPANSGNIAHYVQWAKEVSGVSKVRVYDLARGPGTVDVVLIADGNEVAHQKLIEAVEENIERQRPIGADVLVVSGQAVDITVAADVLVKAGYTAESIQNSFYRLLEEHCSAIAFQSQVLSYLGMVNVLFDCPGVIDASGFTINGQSGSLHLTERQFPVAQLPVVTVIEDDGASGGWIEGVQEDA
ncbi:MAG: baseplate J/gp47 family protein [Acetatifactor sp.]|nr:baseplate J/gp47 family protein [Acetatifactor sp.]